MSIESTGIDTYQSDLDITPGEGYVEYPGAHSNSGIDPIQADVDNPARREALAQAARDVAATYTSEHPGEPNPFEESISDVAEGRSNP